LGDGGLIVTVTTGPTHGGVSISGTTVTYTPSANYHGTDSYIYQICDGDGDCSTATVNVTVNSVNDTPVAVDDNATVNEDSNVSTDVSTNDTSLGDGGLVVTVTTGPTHGTISVSGTTVTYTPTANYHGTDSYTYQICDGDGDCSTAAVDIVVNSVNDTPVAANDNISTMESTPVKLSVLSNDSGLGDGGLIVTVSVNPLHGTAVVNGDNTITYTPNAGYLGSDSYTYQVCDGDGDCSTAIVSIIVDNVDDIPLAVNDVLSVNEDGSKTFDLLVNDTGLGDGGLVVTIPTNGKHGTAIVNIDNTITYTPAADYYGNDTITYQVCDVDGDCATAQVIITVNSVDDTPLAVNDNVNVNEDSNVSTDVSLNDTGLGDGGLVVTVTNGPTHGGVSISGTTVTYTPTANYHGTDSYTYQICDGDGDCSTATVNVTVNSVNDVPIAVNDTATVNEDFNVSTDVSANDTGLGDGGLVVSITTGPTHGAVSVSGTTVTYTPTANYHGTDSYIYQICDGDGDCSTATVDITVNSLNDAPVALNDNISTMENTPVKLSVLSNDAGLGDGGLIVTIGVNPLHGTAVVNGDNTITYTPTAGYLGLDSYTYQVCDGDGDCSTAIVSVIVDNVDDIPIALNDVLSVNEDGSKTFDLLANDTGLGDGGLVVTIPTNGKHGTAIVNIDNTITYTPEADYYGNDTIIYQVCDVDGDCATAQVIITVTGVDDTPVAVNDNVNVNEDSNINIDVLANDTGLGDGGLNVTITSGPTHGIVLISGTTVIYSPMSDYFGEDSLTYQVCDGDGDCSSATVKIIVDNVDDNPIANMDNASVNEGSSVIINVLSNDSGLSDGGINVSISAIASRGNAIVNADHTVTYQSSVGYIGTDSITYQVCDVDGDCATAKVYILIDNINDLPIALSDTATLNEDGNINIIVISNDKGLSDGGLVVSIPNNGKHGSAIVNADNTVTYTPATDYCGSDTITYQVCDVNADCSTAQIVLAINCVDDQPVVINDTIVMNEDTPTTFWVIANDKGLGDGGITVSIPVNGKHGTAIVNPDKTVTYTPATDYYGSDTIIYQVCDIDGDCVTGYIVLTINNVDDLPVANIDNVITVEDSPLVISVLANDTGLGDGGITVSVPSNGKHGNAIVNPDGTITYTPNAGYNGNDTVSYQVCDADGDCVTSQIVVSVTSTNHIPSVTPSVTSITTPVNTPVEVCFTVNDSDNDLLTVTPKLNHGTLVSSGNANCFLYTPEAGYTGVDTIKITWCDPEGACVTGVIPVTITPVAEKPVAAIDTLHLITIKGKNVSGCIGMVTSTEGLTASIIADPENGKLSIENQLCIKYEPTNNYTGKFNVPVVICNTAGLCDTVIVEVYVVPAKIPHGFSPNGDPYNEYFVIEGAELYEKVSVKIFNRWGNIVYENDAYKNDWDGTSKNSFTLGNSKLPSGTYFYVVDFHNGNKPSVGYVYLSR
jgi:gliding motility-associated-like protein